MAVLKKIKFGNTTSDIQFTEVKTVSGGVITANGAHTDLTDGNNPEYTIDLTVADDGTLLKDNGALKVGNVPATQVSVADEDGKFKATNVETALKELKDDIDNVISDGKTYSIVDDTKNVQDLPTNVLKRYRLQQTVGSTKTLIGEPIDILKDNSLLAAKLSTMDASWDGSAIADGEGEEALVLVYKDANGNAQVVAINVSDFLKENEFGNGLQVTNGVVSVKIDTASEKDTENADFLTVGADGVKIQGIKNEIDRKIAALDVNDTAAPGQYVSQVSETDGKIAVERANVSDAVLNGYEKGSDATAIAATDSLKTALSKLENQVDKAKAAATTKVEKDSNASHLTLESTPAADGSVTYVIGENDIASKTALDDEITRAKSAETTIDSAVGLTKDTDNETRTYSNDGEYIGKKASNTVKSDIKALDTQLKTVSDNLAEIKYHVDGTTLILDGITQDTNLTA